MYMVPVRHSPDLPRADVEYYHFMEISCAALGVGERVAKDAGLRVPAGMKQGSFRDMWEPGQCRAFAPASYSVGHHDDCQ